MKVISPAEIQSYPGIFLLLIYRQEQSEKEMKMSGVHHLFASQYNSYNKH